MGRRILMRVLICVGSILIIAGTAILGWSAGTSDDPGEITVTVRDGATETVEFEGLGLIPGESIEYEIKLKGDRSTAYDLTLDFVDLEESMKLKYFARVKILSGDEVICDELLAVALVKEDIHLRVDFTESKNTNIKIVYYMPAEVGNEAKNAEAVFKLMITADSE